MEHIRSHLDTVACITNNPEVSEQDLIYGEDHKLQQRDKSDYENLEKHNWYKKSQKKKRKKNQKNFTFTLLGETGVTRDSFRFSPISAN